MYKIKIGSKFIGDLEPPYFIADIAANHDGKIDRAFRLIELAHEAGADAAKFQNFQAPKIVSYKGFAEFGSQISHQAAWKNSVYETYREASVPYSWTAKIKEKCADIGIEYFTSPYDFETVDHVDPFVNVYKIGSGDISWLEIIEYIARKGKPVLIATGASTLVDVQRAMDLLLGITSDVVLMQCNTNYTTNPENYKFINLNVLKSYRVLYPNVILGLSDHTPGHTTVLGALALGARVIEKHFTDDNNREGPDHKFAMNPKSWKEMVVRARELDSALGDGIKKVEDNERDTVILQRRGLRYTRDIDIDTILTQKDLIPLRPLDYNGIPPYEIAKILGRKVCKNVGKDMAVRWTDFI